MKTLFQGADILLYGQDGWQLLPNGFLGVQDDTICFIGAQKPADAYDTVKSLPGHLLLPGLYNLHTHTSMVLMRGLGSGLPLQRWLEEKMFPVEAKLTEEDISVGSRLAMMEMLACGTVSFTDMYDFPHITAQQAIAAGMKANLSRPVLSFSPEETYEDSARVAASRAFFQEYNGAANGDILVDCALHAEYTSHPHIVQSYAEECLSLGTRMHLHLSETKKEHEECKARHGKTPAQYFASLGVFASPTIAAHCVWCEPEDVRLLAQHGVTSVHNPSSNMKLGSGFMPLPAFLAAGANLALGTDGAASNNNLNLFEEMHLASIIHNGFLQDPTALHPGQVLHMATLAGAAAQGRPNCGQLAIGAKADIIAVSLAAPHMMPVHDAPALLTYSAQAADVSMTMVNGRVLYENGQFLTIDTERVRHDLQSATKRLFGS